MNSNISTTPPKSPTLLDINTIEPTFREDLDMSDLDMSSNNIDIVSLALHTQPSFDLGNFNLSPQVNPSPPLGLASHGNDSAASFLPTSSAPLDPGCAFLDASHLPAALAFPPDIHAVSKNVGCDGCAGGPAQHGGQKRSKLVLESVSYRVMMEILQVIFISNSQVRMSLRSQVD